MGWKEWGDPVKLDDEETDPRLGIVVIIFCLLSILMYILGKSDGKEDALKSEACTTVEILEEH